MTSQPMDNWARARLVLIAGSLIMALTLGTRHAFGLFLQPISMDAGWGRETFAFAIALQNLVWGAAQPFTGMLADRFGSGKVILGGAILYAGGLALMSIPQDAVMFSLTAGVLIGLGLSGTTMPIVFGAISRALPPEKRSMAMGVSMSIGSFGQFAMLPIALGLLGGFGWQSALLIMAAIAALILPLSFALREPGMASCPVDPNDNLTVREALREAFGERDFWLLFWGFFACGFQVVFIAVHLPAYLADEGMASGVSTTVLALIGLFNIAGAYLAGFWGGRYKKPGMLAWLYMARGATILAFITIPMTEWTAYAFGILMGLFWLSTVPLTNGVVASIFGVRNMAMLGGFVFFGHQLGSFAGGWLGGVIYDRTGSYDVAWWIAIGLSLIAAALNAPIRETAMADRRAATQ
ncbi:MFS transporter [Aestuariivita boseongensis]|uniref:MFS transporter n=1 Tax=Aestuariivita boseongensis TaxID=1470562 RepID=UPI00067F9E04|nr:MFS transporter [Aestuariivita boseongensis]